MSTIIQTKASSQWQSGVFNLKKSREIRNSVFIRSMFAKALVFENVYRILPVIDTTAELYPAFCMLGPWFIVILNKDFCGQKRGFIAQP